MAMFHNDVGHGPLHPVLGRELTLFNRALNVQVIALLEGQCHLGEVSVKAQVVPVSVFLSLLVSALVSLSLSKACVRNRRSLW
jgi:hypothetical protein